MGMNYALTVAQWVFWPLCICVALLPLRFGLPAYMLLAQVDPTGPDFSSLTGIGLANLVKVIVLPSLFYFRLRHNKTSDLVSAPFSMIWLAFVGYVTIASVWSPFQLSALKMVGYLCSYTLLFVVFVKGWRRGWFNGHTITVVAWTSLLIAVVQTYSLGNYYGTSPDGTPYATQFTTFIDAQSFAPFLLALLVFEFVRGKKGQLRSVTCLALILGIILAGSRYVVVATILSFIAVYLGRALIDRGSVNIRLLIKVASVTVVLVVGLALSVMRYLPASRLNELLRATVSPQENVEDVFDFGWRLKLYSELGDAFQAQSLGRMIVGSGTSSGKTLMLQFDPTYGEETDDANRVIHSEFLRALYEWGISGFVLFLLFLVAITRSCVREFLRSKSSSALVCMAFLPGIIIGLAIENILAAPARPNGVAYVLVFACFAAFQGRIGTVRRVQLNPSKSLWHGMKTVRRFGKMHSARPPLLCSAEGL